MTSHHPDNAPENTVSCPFSGELQTSRSEAPAVNPIIRTDGQPAPTADGFDVSQLMVDPYPTYRRLRAQSPVVWVPSIERYLVTSFEGCHAIEQDQETYTAAISGIGSTMIRALGGTPMLRKDDPAHAPERTAVNHVFRPRSLKESWLPVFEANAQKYVDLIQAVGPDEANLDRDFAAPLASQNLIDLLGIPQASVEDMQRWSSSFVSATANLVDDPDVWLEAERSQAEVEIALDELIPRYRRNPNSSVASALANSGLPREAISANVKLTISGGMNEPQHALTASVFALCTHPKQLEAVLAAPDLWPAVFDESIRWMSPIGMYPRQTTRETTLQGVHLPSGASIGVVVGAANRDPQRFSDPEAFDIHRPRTSHLAFGSGVHMCAGSWAARMSIGQVALPRLFRSIPTLRLDDRRETIFRGWVFRGATQMPVTWAS